MLYSALCGHVFAMFYKNDFMCYDLLPFKVIQNSKGALSEIVVAELIDKFLGKLFVLFLITQMSLLLSALVDLQ